MLENDKVHLLSMIWGVDQSGYQILDSCVLPTRKRWKAYDPFEDRSGLARKFSKIPVRNGTADGTAVLEFANQYGLLGLGRSDGMEPENLEEWASEILSVRYIFTQLKKGDQEEAAYAFTGKYVVLPMRLSVHLQGKPNQRVLQMAPSTLCGAIWLMVADEIAKGAQYKSCKAPGCLEWFPIRSNKKFCSEACKQAAYRERNF